MMNNVYKRKFLTEKDIPISDPILLAIMSAESDFDPNLTRFEPDYRWVYQADVFARRCGITLATEIQLQKMSWGLGQIMGGTARFLGYTGPIPLLLNVETNAQWCRVYLDDLLKRYNGDVLKAVSAYNQGNARGCGTETGCHNQPYVDKVQKRMQMFQQTSA